MSWPRCGHAPTIHPRGTVSRRQQTAEQRIARADLERRESRWNRSDRACAFEEQLDGGGALRERDVKRWDGDLEFAALIRKLDKTDTGWRH